MNATASVVDVKQPNNFVKYTHTHTEGQWKMLLHILLSICY